MNKIISALSLSLLIASTLSANENTKDSKTIKIVNSKSESLIGPSETFTGKVRVTNVLTPDDSSSISSASVAFEPGARSAWHTHPKGQLLVVTEGSGLIQAEGQPIRSINVGDTVWTPPNVKHWHGASPNSKMVHTATQELVNGTPVKWMEKVSDEQYKAKSASKLTNSDTNPAMAYYVSEYEVLDRNGAKPYSAQVDATFKKYGGRYIVRGGKINSLEGAGFKGGMVVIAFDSMEKAQAWYNSPEYAAIKPIRHKTMKSRVYIVEGTKIVELTESAETFDLAEEGVAVRIADLTIDPAQLDAYTAAVKEEMDDAVRLEPGVIAIYATAIKGKANQIRFVEIYANEKAYLTHRETPHFKKYLEATKSMITARELFEGIPVKLAGKKR